MRISGFIVFLLAAGVVSAQDAPSDIQAKTKSEMGPKAASPQNSGLPAEARVDDRGDDDDRVAKELSAEDQKLKTLLAKVNKALDFYQRRQLNTRDHSPWEVMHSLVAYGCDTQIYRGGPGGQKVNAIGWLCWNG
ncbi:MAG: hypothetical protein IIA67_13280, partial [Planctomycetes bacterium]|nr:hypothetical protein [Planctomycetota bacterium]